MVELSAIWVVVIVLIGIAIGVYSVCKGCQGMREQAAQTAHNERMATHALVAPFAGLVQQLRSDEAHQNHVFLISGANIYDKNPPSYDEIIEPPPSYEETLKFCSAESKDQGSAHVNLGCDVTSEEGACALPAGPSTVPVHSTTKIQDKPNESSHVSVNMES